MTLSGSFLVSGLVAALLCSSDAWSTIMRSRSTMSMSRTDVSSSSSTSSVSRRIFFGGAASTAATAAAAITFGVPAPATAASEKVYMPPAESLKDKLVVITGGTTGLGLESAKRLAAAGATIVLTSRTQAKGDAAVSAVKESLGGNDGGRIFSLVLDLDDLSNVKSFPDRLQKLISSRPSMPQSVDVLLNNAGVMALQEKQLTKDGFEKTFQSNHLGHFALTAGLLPLLNASKATVINVSSEAYNFARDAKNKNNLNLDNLNSEVDFGPWSSYGTSKLANVYFTQELQRRADAAGLGDRLQTVSLHPGAVATDLGRNLIGVEKWDDLKAGKLKLSPLESFALNALNSVTKTVPEGASTQVYLATMAAMDKPLNKGAFYVDMAPRLKGMPNDEQTARSLWEMSERMADTQFDFTTAASASKSLLADSNKQLTSSEAN